LGPGLAGLAAGGVPAFAGGVAGLSCAATESEKQAAENTAQNFVMQ